ncbi:VOC family protein [Methyloversatilis thermotolerans]|uniref:VOC family protein n=1 Tax=Methyloversatilis thermotolerans TaxID=1346290 RepID=UPI00037E72BA|nr:VOC family protein [Methyloversatilis thermotolerans]
MNDTHFPPRPDALHTVTPHIVCSEASAAIDFYRRAFGAIELMRLPGAEGRILHAQVRIGDSVVMLVDAQPEWCVCDPNTLGGSPVVLHLQVEDVDAWYARAVTAGAAPLMAPEDMFWGDRYARVRDPNGHEWAIATRVREVPPEELLARAATLRPDCNSKEN